MTAAAKLGLVASLAAAAAVIGYGPVQICRRRAGREQPGRKHRLRRVRER